MNELHGTDIYNTFNKMDKFKIWVISKNIHWAK